MNVGFGELAAMATAFSWGVSTQIQGAVGRLVGSTGVTLLRMPYQIFFVTLLCLVMRVDTHLTWPGFGYLFLSGLFGLFLSDYLLYQAIGIIGPPMAILILSTSTLFSVVFGWIFLGETMPAKALAGIGITLAGILLVITERTGSTLMPGQERPQGRMLLIGALASAGAAMAMSCSFICLKMGMKTGIDPLWATFVRLINGALALWLVGAVRGWVNAIRRGLLQYPKVYWMLFLSTACGSAGLWLSSVAMNLAPVGIAATLIGLQPIAVTLIGAVWYKRRLTWRIIGGITVAFAGTATICLM
ncbi:DMT family transporter [Deltaproteobacteria bacterium OttesenSCG-928-M10]|nr:DMT family transporter [Deltaproteobacteria bacterium OttesenSCG-928-M10]